MSPKDVYSNFAYGTAVEVAAGTLAYGEIQSGVSLFEKVAWLISRIEYRFDETYVNLIIDQADAIRSGLFASNLGTSFNQSDSSLIDWVSLQEADFGTMANAQLYWQPYIKDLSTLPGGGLLIPPNPLYLGVQGVSLASVCSVTCRIYFTYVTLKPEDYWELVESRRIIS